MVRAGWIPPRSPFSLIQEDLWPDEWLILVSCVMLNCTSRKQVERVLPEFRHRWPTPQAFMAAVDAEVADVCRSLGFANRRTTNLKRMTRAYLCTDWHHAKELPGIGEYASAAWRIFCEGTVGDEPPKDHALVRYFEWARARSALVADGEARVSQEPRDLVAVDEEAHAGDVAQLDPRADPHQLAVRVEDPAA